MNQGRSADLQVGVVPTFRLAKEVVMRTGILVIVAGIALPVISLGLKARTGRPRAGATALRDDSA